MSRTLEPCIYCHTINEPDRRLCDTCQAPIAPCKLLARKPLLRPPYTVKETAR